MQHCLALLTCAVTLTATLQCAAEGGACDDMPSVYEHSEGGGADENEPATSVRPPFAETQLVRAVAAEVARLQGGWSDGKLRCQD